METKPIIIRRAFSEQMGMTNVCVCCALPFLNNIEWEDVSNHDLHCFTIQSRFTHQIGSFISLEWEDGPINCHRLPIFDGTSTFYHREMTD